MKCHKRFLLWKGIESEADLKQILPAPWVIHTFVGPNNADGKDNVGHATCAVPSDEDASCDELYERLFDVIDDGRYPDDGEAGHVGEVAKTYGRGSDRKKTD